MTLKDKIIAEFEGKVVRKDLVSLVKGNNPVPAYVLEYLLGQFADRELNWISNIYRANSFFLFHGTKDCFHQIVDKAKRTSLGSVPVDSQVLTFEGLYDEIGNHPTIVRCHSWSVSIENTYHTYIHLVFPVIIKK